MGRTELVYGIHAVLTLLRQAPAQLRQIHVQSGRDDKRLRSLNEQAHTQGVRVQHLSRKELDALVPGARHQGVVAEMEAGAAARAPQQDLAAFVAALDETAFLLVLDGIQDPHNLGACLRSAAAAGVQAVIMPRDRATGITPVVRKVACGAAETLPVYTVTNLARALRGLRESGIWIYGAAAGAGESVYAVDLRGPLAVVLGGEARGLRRLTREHCDVLVTIPMTDRVQSLNVSVAAGVILFEARRQRLQ
jgi:23S rRNA (guanosine2251-2'-O)-methyltransferase